MSRTAALAAAFVFASLPSAANAQDPDRLAATKERQAASASGSIGPLSWATRPSSELAPPRPVRPLTLLIWNVDFVGLRRIARETLLDKMLSRPGLRYSSDAITHDVRTLAQLGWFDDSLRVEAQLVTDADSVPEDSRRLVLTFYLQERPFLTGVEYVGSRVLADAQIEKLLTERKLMPKLGEPANRAKLRASANEIADALHEFGYPNAGVSVQEEVSPRATVRVRFAITDGPYLPLARVEFTGNPAIPEKQLRRQMSQIRPGALFAGLRGQNVYTRESFEQDRERLLTYYRNHGYPDARIGAPSIRQFERASRRWVFPLNKSKAPALTLVVPVQAGSMYRIDRLQISPVLTRLLARNDGRVPRNTEVQQGKRYSDQAVENLRWAWQAQVRCKLQNSFAGSWHQVDASRTRDPDTHTMRITLRLSESPPYIVRRLQFEGLKRFPDRYFRKRILLKEGTVLDERMLEAGLTRINRIGYFKPIKREDVRIETNDLTHTADVTIHVQEIGVQRVSFVGGSGGFGNTLGLAYLLYNVFDREELLSSRIESGPETLQLAVGLAKEGFLGSRGTLVFSVFNMFLRPRLTGSVKGPFFTQRTGGVTADYSYVLTSTDSLSMNYRLTRSTTSYSYVLPEQATGITAANVSSKTSSHSLELGWDRNRGNQRIDFSDSVSGGLLGGRENLLRSKGEYERIFRDSLFNPRNAWAFRGTFSAVGSYSGTTPVSALDFVGDQYVRGLTAGELGPYAALVSTSSSDAPTYSGVRAGANLITAFNVEYRIPIATHGEGATFFDLGSGRLLPNWFGSRRLTLLNGTNGILHGSTGVELRWTLPVVNVPVRTYYALSVLRPNRWFTLPDGSLFKTKNRLAGFGWGLGSMF